MPHTPQTVYYDIKRRYGLLFVEFRDRDFNRLLTPDAAIEIKEIPEGFVIEPNPETPGRNAFVNRKLTGPAMMGALAEAGFRVDAEDAETMERDIAEKAAAKAEAEAEALAAAEAEAATESGVNTMDLEEGDIVSIEVLDVEGEAKDDRN